MTNKIEPLDFGNLEVKLQGLDTSFLDNSNYSYQIDPLLTGTIDLGNLTTGLGATGLTGSNYVFSSTPYTSTWNINSSSPGLTLTEGADITIGKKSLSQFMDKVESRLAILQPDPELLEKFEALKQAYEHYKTLEALCTGNPPKDPNA